MSSTPGTFRTRTIAALGGIVLLVSACSSSGGASTAPSVAAASTPAPTSASSPAASSGDNTVAVANGAVGAFLTGPNGMTLYTFARTPPTPQRAPARAQRSGRRSCSKAPRRSRRATA